MYAGNVTPARVLQHWPAFDTVKYARKSNSADGHEQAHSPAQHWSLLFDACSTNSQETYATTFVSAKLNMMIRKVPGSKVNCTVHSSAWVVKDKSRGRYTATPIRELPDLAVGRLSLIHI